MPDVQGGTVAARGADRRRRHLHQARPDALVTTRPASRGLRPELSLLQSNVPPAEWPRVRAVLEQELSRPVEEVFAQSTRSPVAAASVAQVHLARLVGGEEVVVKVQRPDARRQALADLDIVLRLGAWLERTTSWGRRLGVESLARGFARSLEEELDYRVEQANMRAVSEGVAHAGRPRMHVPMRARTSRHRGSSSWSGCAACPCRRRDDAPGPSAPPNGGPWPTTCWVSSSIRSW